MVSSRVFIRFDLKFRSNYRKMKQTKPMQFNEFNEFCQSFFPFKPVYQMKFDPESLRCILSLSLLWFVPQFQEWHHASINNLSVLTHRNSFIFKAYNLPSRSKPSLTNMDQGSRRTFVKSEDQQPLQLRLSLKTLSGDSV